MLPEQSKKSLHDTACSLTAVLLFSYLLSLGGRWNWFLDLFSHFNFQYFIGGLMLGSFLLWLGNKRFAFIALAVAAISLCESRIPLQHSLQISSPKTEAGLSIMQYNKNVALGRLDSFAQYIEGSSDKPDVIILQEAVPQDIEKLERLKPLYPYQINEPRRHAFGMIVMSRQRPLSWEIIPLAGEVFDSFTIKMEIKPDHFKSSVNLYALHVQPPVSPSAFRQRNNNLLTIAQHIKKTQNVHSLMIGDWNITPYSPHFRDALSVSGLKYQSYGLQLNASWPSMTFPLFKIPIDHVLYSPDMIQTDKKIISSFGSDHNAHIASFAEK